MKTIRVTARHIKEGNRKASRTCPIAKSLKEATGLKNICVGLTDFVHSGNDDGVALPPIAKKFIRAFDSGKKVKPFSFRIDV